MLTTTTCSLCRRILALHTLHLAPPLSYPHPIRHRCFSCCSPFELATLRLFNMVGILPKWSELSPAKDTLLTQQGGTIAFEGTDTLFRFDDSGILKYTVGVGTCVMSRTSLDRRNDTSPSSVTLPCRRSYLLVS